jgi:hypothetical protein
MHERHHDSACMADERAASLAQSLSKVTTVSYEATSAHTTHSSLPRPATPNNCLAPRGRSHCLRRRTAGRSSSAPPARRAAAIGESRLVFPAALMSDA